MTATGFTFDSSSAATMGLIVKDIRRPVLPDVIRSVAEVAGMEGAYLFGVRFGELTIEVDVCFQGASMAAAATTLHDLGAWLSATTPKELTFDDETGLVRYATLSGASQLSAIAAFRTGTLVFICSDPYAYATSVDTTNITDGDNTINNAGRASVYPSFDIVVADDTSFVDVMRADTGESVRVGVAVAAGGIVTEPMTLSFHDDMSSIGAWDPTTVADTDIDAYVDMVMASNGNQFYVEDYLGETLTNPAGWHGPSYVRELAAPLTDFHAQMSVYFWNTKTTLGRMQMLLLDAGDNIIGSIGVMDAWATLKKSLIITSPVAWYDVPTDAWNDLSTGTLFVSRVGKLWNLAVQVNAKRNDWAIQIPYMAASYTDEAGTFDADLAKVVISMCQWKDSDTPADGGGRMWVSDMVVNGVNSAGTAGHTMFAAGETLRIDNRTGRVQLKAAGATDFGEMSNSFDAYGRQLPMSALVDFSSVFFDLPPGNTTVTVSLDDTVTATGTETHTERCL